MTFQETIDALRADAAKHNVQLDDGAFDFDAQAAAPYIKLIAEQQALLNHQNARAQRHAIENIAVRIGLREREIGPWRADAPYREGETVTHEGVSYVALADVQQGVAPDGVWDEDAMTGGWRPEVEPT